jgi:serine/threonine protein kinase
VETYFAKGIKGFRVFHDSDYFHEKSYFHKENEIAEKWITAIKDQSQFFDVTKKYERLNLLGKGKFSTVYLCRSYETDEVVAMKHIDKKQLTPREKDFLREEIQIVRSINHPNVVEMKDCYETL